MSTLCLHKQFPSTIIILYPLIYAIPTMILNMAVCRIIFRRKEFCHVFYRLFCLLTLSFLFRWLARNILMKFTKLETSCFVIMDILRVQHRLAVILFFPKTYFDSLGHLACFCIALNRLTTVILPIRSNEVWWKNRHCIFTFLALVAFLISVPGIFARSDVQAQNQTVSLKMISDFGLSFAFYNSILSLITFTLIVPITAATLFIAYRNTNISKFAKEFKIIILGTALASLTSLGCLYHVVLFLSDSYHIEGLQGIGHMIEDPTGDLVYLLPVWILVFYDRAIRKYLCNNYITSNRSSMVLARSNRSTRSTI